MNEKAFTINQEGKMIQPIKDKDKADGKYKVLYPAFGKRFENLEDAEKYFQKTKAKRERLAGRPLNEIELMDGLTFEDNRSPAQRIDDEAWAIVPDPTEPQLEPESWGKKELREAKLEYRRKQVGDRLALAEEFVRINNEKLSAVERAAKHESTERIKAREQADKMLEQVQFSRLSTINELVQAERLVKQAEGDLIEFESMRSELAKVYRDRATEEQHRVKQQLASMQYSQSELIDSAPEAGTWNRPFGENYEVNSLTGTRRDLP